MAIKNIVAIAFLVFGLVSILFGDRKTGAPFILRIFCQGKFGKEGMDKTSVKFWKWSFGIILIIVGIIILIYPVS